ncbi:MAG: hypothetical protein IPJ61_13085 [Tessaracoccus sp.]|uniref:hypothetical protein n=1 Tax=Tessaracoccus sp. TaxID=1971211 RepID=UPI001EB50D37|nr:hypothetical protein [Tessaracoccus sp.]MBK7821969.1 hypothetical protein [Tessaracoccus sp.]
MTEDFYTDNAEWYAALVAGTRGELDAAVRDLLGPLPGGAVVDIASGVGSCLPALQDLGAERLFAVEPSRAMRAGLMTTIAHDPELMSRTTIVPMAFPQALEHLPSQWSAGIMFNAIGHLEDRASSTGRCNTALFE